MRIVCLHLKCYRNRTGKRQLTVNLPVLSGPQPEQVQSRSGHHPVSRWCLLLTLLLMLLTSGLANAGPTLGINVQPDYPNYNPAVGTICASPASWSYTPPATGGSMLRDCVEQLMRQSCGVSGNEVLPDDSAVGTMPAAPGSLIMALLGFIGLTLARDRYYWQRNAGWLLRLMAVAALFVPRALARLAGLLVADMAGSNPVRVKLPDWRLTFAAAGPVRYAGLLRRLAASFNPMNFFFSSVFYMKTRPAACLSCLCPDGLFHRRLSFPGENNLTAPQPRPVQYIRMDHIPAFSVNRFLRTTRRENSTSEISSGRDVIFRKGVVYCV